MYILFVIDYYKLNIRIDTQKYETMVYYVRNSSTEFNKWHEKMCRIETCYRVLPMNKHYLVGSCNRVLESCEIEYKSIIINLEYESIVYLTRLMDLVAFTKDLRCEALQEHGPSIVELSDDHYFRYERFIFNVCPKKFFFELPRTTISWSLISVAKYFGLRRNFGESFEDES